MIFVHLMGGLGNQMSQVAFSYIVSKKYNLPIIIETTAYRTYKRRSCSIQKMRLDDSISIREIPKHLIVSKDRITQEIFHLYAHFMLKNKNLPPDLFYALAKWGHLYSMDSSYFPLPEMKKNHVDIYGYFLVVSYYKPFYSQICQLFEVKEECISDKARNYYQMIKQDDHSVAISLRLQDDYVKDPIMNVCTEEYFNHAVEEMNRRFSESHFYIFADDMEKAKKYNLSISKPIYIEGITDVEGIYLMKHCRHFIISNSSFSWWGAFLSKCEQKLIIAPTPWVNNKKDNSEKYYENMIMIDSNGMIVS